MLGNTLFYFFQPIMIFIENFLSFGDFDFFGSRGFFPRQIREPFDISSCHRRFGRHGLHELEPFQFLFGFLINLFRHFCLFNFLFELIKIAFEFIPLTQFLLDGFHLLIQIELFLTSLHLFSHPPMDALLNLQNFHF